MNIYSHGQKFKAYSCTVCGALDSDPELLARHEAMHQFYRESVKSQWAKTMNGRGPRGIYHKSGGPRKTRGTMGRMA